MRTVVSALTVLLALTGCGAPGGGAAAVTTPTTQADEPLALAGLTRDHPCGLGFRASDAAERVGLVIELRADDLDAGGPIDLEVRNAALLVGRDLFGNWCKGVGDEVRVPDVATRNEVVDGTLEDLRIEPGRPPTATARIRGLAVRDPSGATRVLGNIAVANPCWGCGSG